MLKKLFLILLLSASFASLTSLCAEEISAFDVNINVQQSGELVINESIEYDFGSLDKHGIFRDIPFTVKNSSTLTDLGLYDFSVTLDGETVEWNQSTMKSAKAGEIIRIKIGSPSTYVTGRHSYKISYKVKKGVLPAANDKADDAIRWNVIGTGWTVPLNNITANFFLPNSVSQSNSNVSTFTGKYGSKSSTASNKWLNSNQLQVDVKALNPQEGLTVEIAYPANILDQNGQENIKASFFDKILGNWQWAALLGFFVYLRKQFTKYAGFSDNRSIAVQYEAPKGMTVLQSGLILDKFADNEDFAAAVMELGYLGYLEIQQENKKDQPTLSRTKKQLDGLTKNQKYLLDEILFKGSETFIMHTPATKLQASTLRDGFKHINENLYAWSAEDGYMVENPEKIRTRFLWKSILLLLPILILAFATLAYKQGTDAIFLLMFPITFGGVALFMILSKGISNKIFGLVFGTAGMIPLFILYSEGVSLSNILLGPIGVVIVIIAALAYTYKKLGNFTPKGAQAQTHLLGLKDFIKRVKQDEIKRRLEVDPLYLEKMLPYAVLFGETKHWLSFFTTLNVSQPGWYHGNPSNMQHFASNMNSASSPPSSGGGMSGGGGSSGGGGGGGGGGSW